MAFALEPGKCVAANVADDLLAGRYQVRVKQAGFGGGQAVMGSEFWPPNGAILA